METHAKHTHYRDTTGKDTDPFSMGYEACERGDGRGDNPFQAQSTDYGLWDRGFVRRANGG
jgi:hypothetical protein